jgi:hypothetical protein
MKFHIKFEPTDLRNVMNKLMRDWLIDLLYLMPLSAIFQLYHMVTSFSGGRSQSPRREPPTMGKQLVNFITCDYESSAPIL